MLAGLFSIFVCASSFATLFFRFAHAGGHLTVSSGLPGLGLERQSDICSELHRWCAQATPVDLTWRLAQIPAMNEASHPITTVR